MKGKKYLSLLLSVMLMVGVLFTTCTGVKAATTTKTYDFSALTYATGYNNSYSISSGKLNVSYDKQYGEIKFYLPETLDMSVCSEVTFNANCTNGKTAFKLYDTGGTEVSVKYDFNTSGDCTFAPDTNEKINCIGIMSLETSSYSAVINSVSFVMEDTSSTEETIDTSAATLLKTYGNLLGHDGSCVTSSQMQNSNTLSVIKNQYNSVTMENEMKPDAILGSSASLLSVSEAKALGYYIPDDYTETTVPKLNYTTVDKMLQICYENGLSLRAHTLVWHQQTPNWLFRSSYSSSGSYVSESVMNARMEFYIKSMINHVYNSQYGSVVYAWDVVNEYLHGVKSGSGWQQVYGSSLGTKPGFVKSAFTYAYEALEEFGLEDSVSLFCNDYNTYLEADDMIDLINYINSDKKICSGIGMQAHLATTYPSASLFKTTLQQFADAGLEIQITELDVQCTSESVQAQYYYSIMSAILSVYKAGGNITGVTWWGLYDSVSWRSSDSPLMFSSLTTPKQAYTSVLEAYVDAGYTVAGEETQPTQSSTPSTSPSPSATVEPSESATPSQSVEPSESTTPSQSVEPSESTTPSQSVTPSESTEPAESSDDVAGAMTISSEWSTGYNGNFTITNNSDQAISGWTVSFASADTISSVWCANLVSSENNVYVISNADWNGAIPAHSSVSFGFSATKSGSEAATPSNILVTAK